jgi:hypothetical protein
MMFVPHRKHTYRPLRSESGISLLVVYRWCSYLTGSTCLHCPCYAYKVHHWRHTFLTVFIMCWSPYIVFDLLQVYDYFSRTQANIAIATFVQSLAPLNSAANPLIYCIFSNNKCRSLRYAKCSSAGGSRTTKQLHFIPVILSVIFEVFTEATMKNAVFWDITPCGSCKNRRFGWTLSLLHQGDKNRWTRNNASCN